MKTPNELLKLAQKEPIVKRDALKQYADSVLLLRRQGLSFRQIADWIHKHTGIKTDYNAVYRLYVRETLRAKAEHNALEGFPQHFTSKKQQP
jgi:hypothetical protein